ncbi:hypothetical protein [Mucilaginibacter sp. PAMB04168]|uniref:hypothetical protein n=1 Tax=Mucilaginibacter sp. PAMB04168 TaxID=3138567 RepID=UPI0031F6EDFC
MSQRTYLFRSTNGHREVLAEIKNMIPFFWLTLIRKSDLQAKVPEMEKAAKAWEDEAAYEQYMDAHPGATHIKVPGTQAIKNAQAAVPFIHSSFPHVAELFSDFITYLTQHLKPGDDLELDIIALADFSGIEKFIDTLMMQLSCIEQKNVKPISGNFEGDVKYSLTGYAGDFEKQSPGFRKIAQVKNQVHRKGPVKQIPLTSAQLRSRRIKSIILLLIGVATSLLSILYMVRHQITFSFTILALAGVVCIWEGVAKLRSRFYDVW